jgi:hypothetical protein
MGSNSASLLEPLLVAVLYLVVSLAVYFTHFYSRQLAAQNCFQQEKAHGLCSKCLKVFSTKQVSLLSAN